ncbi:polyprenol phosphomannose-dependent alpha 1,6 mannosyltransferase MptB [Corynebacterium sp. HS2168-gen11]|uniref:polyprenol phosphomannose-dependent alpha 1,6 mannosyltransferase MptB n=1 Tax=Corynebacterium sp. HS2168-gen11 TaxID=2974027 RepID=UPI00216B5EE3|nr:polyprenol phosphomannose-dependent alpha 1,6 mannosyltransferase MptB [Corynebacterium sp. HS2168-gen11]MCS4535124.1 polyprenol phosphomannose-dependent alpha 1,6 mannosyltransferase MptB [Corynebacterium sp. HS2168-gen11]
MSQSDPSTQPQRRLLSRFGTPGQHAASLHSVEDEFGDALSRYDHASGWVKTAVGVDLLTPIRNGGITLRESDTVGAQGSFTGHFVLPTLSYQELRRFAFIRWLGTLGAVMIGLGALGAGALPVVESPYHLNPVGSLLGRMLQTSTVICFVGVGLLVFAWLIMAPFTGVALRHQQSKHGVISMSVIKRTFLAWSLPLLVSAPMFTQDIYSYLANGALILQGHDPYSAGPVDLLGTEHALARSVPFIWAHSPSPYGPVALGLAATIAKITSNNIVLSVIMHRLFAILGVALAGWAVVHLSRRCYVIPQASLWLGVLNPLTILHLIGGIHNESILLGLLLAGVELGLRSVDYLNVFARRRAVLYLTASSFLISCAGMVKVTGFLGLGFTGIAIAHALRNLGRSHIIAWLIAIVAQVVLLVVSVLMMTWFTGISLGWLTVQGGAVTIRSWMSFSTAVGVIFGWFGMQLQLGDHTDALLVVTRTLGVAITLSFIVRMLFATYRGSIHPVGALGVSSLVMVVFFPVVHPWYVLWAILPLAAWANRPFFRSAVILYSTLLSFFILPRGLGLPPDTILSIYLASILGWILIMVFSYVILRKRGIVGLH